MSCSHLPQIFVVVFQYITLPSQRQGSVSSKPFYISSTARYQEQLKLPSCMFCEIFFLHCYLSPFKIYEFVFFFDPELCSKIDTNLTKRNQNFLLSSFVLLTFKSLDKKKRDDIAGLTVQSARKLICSCFLTFGCKCKGKIAIKSFRELYRRSSCYVEHRFPPLMPNVAYWVKI